jgi:hypothetical protein
MRNFKITRVARMENLYFHSPCLDGIVSAVLTWDFLESKFDWTDVHLRAVNYEIRDHWLSSDLQRPFAIVDFLYHPQADFWADHHVTTFLTKRARQDFESRRGKMLVYDDHAGSCAALLWEHLAKAFDHRNPRYAEMVQWAQKTDSAAYESVNEAIFPSSPALRISLSLVLGNQDDYSEKLAHALRFQRLETVAGSPEVRTRFDRIQASMKEGLDRFNQAARIDHDGIVVFDVDTEGTFISRYAPYYFFRDARYSAGIMRWPGGAKITAMRNPWREFESVSLGEICEKLGGGGHRRVGSIALYGERMADANRLLNQLLLEIREKDRNPFQGKPEW